MSRARLRLYHGPEEGVETREDKRSVRLPLGEVLPLLMDAAMSERTWLRDFEHDEVTISTDLYEMILAYQYCRRPGA